MEKEEILQSSTIKKPAKNKVKEHNQEDKGVLRLFAVAQLHRREQCQATQHGEHPLPVLWAQWPWQPRDTAVWKSIDCALWLLPAAKNMELVVHRAKLSVLLHRISHADAQLLHHVQQVALK